MKQEKIMSLGCKAVIEVNTAYLKNLKYQTHLGVLTRFCLSNNSCSISYFIAWMSSALFYNLEQEKPVNE